MRFVERAARQDMCALAKQAQIAGAASCNLLGGSLEVTCSAGLKAQVTTYCTGEAEGGVEDEVTVPLDARDVAKMARDACPGNGQAAFDVVLAAEDDSVQLKIFAATHFSACKAAFVNAQYVFFWPNICQVLTLKTCAI
jgi:hypothetical protein